MVAYTWKMANFFIYARKRHPHLDNIPSNAITKQRHGITVDRIQK